MNTFLFFFSPLCLTMPCLSMSMTFHVCIASEQRISITIFSVLKFSRKLYQTVSVFSSSSFLCMQACLWSNRVKAKFLSGSKIDQACMCACVIWNLVVSHHVTVCSNSGPTVSDELISTPLCHPGELCSWHLYRATALLAAFTDLFPFQEL